MGSSVNSENTAKIKCHEVIDALYNETLAVLLVFWLADLSLSLSPHTLGILGSYVTDGNFHQFPYTTDSLFAQAGTFTSILFIGVIAMSFLLQYLNSNENKQQSAMILAAQKLQGFKLQYENICGVQ